MNKRISTLLTAGLLMVGALFSSANAAVTPTAASGDLQNGSKFYLGNANGYVKTNATYKVSGTAVATYDATGVATFDVAQAALFEVADFTYNATGDFSTFKLKVDGKFFYVKKADGAALDANVTDVATVTNLFTVTGKKLDFASLSVLNVPAYFKVASGQATTYATTGTGDEAKAFVATTPIAAADLNKNLSGNGFKFAFPNAISQPDVNPFDVQILAIDMAAYVGSSTFTGAEGVGEGTYFAVANDKATALKAAIAAQVASASAVTQAATLAAFKAATFIVLDPNTNFGIMGLTAAGEGYGFTTVKGDKLANMTANKKADGQIACVNGAFTVSEEDSQNAPGEYTIKLAKTKVAGDTGTDVNDVFVGAYSLTTGGLKTYITTAVASADKLSLAMTSGSTWAKASDVLSATDATIVNISFLGTKPATAAEAAKSLYGKYLVPAYGNANFTDAVAAAPMDVDVNAPLSQWVVSAVSGHTFTFTNRETNVKFTADLYKTAKAGEYLLGSAALTDANASPITTVTNVTDDLATVANWIGQTIKLTATTVSQGFMALTDAQLEQQAEIVFNGDGAITVDKVYMTYDKGTAPYFTATKVAASSIAWLFEKGESVSNKMKYAYLKDGVVTLKDSVVVTAPSYLLYQKVDGEKNYLDAINAVLTKTKDDALRCYFKKNVDGTYAVVMIDKTQESDAAKKYAQVVKGDATKLSVVTATAAFANTVTLNGSTQYSNVTVDFNNFTESLEAVARHATLDSEEGSVSMKLNKNGILEGIIAGEGLTFWLDTADVDQEIPTFYISKGNGEEAARSFMYFPADSALYWDAAAATYVENPNYSLEGAAGNLKAIFRPATLAGIDTIATTVAGEEVLVAEEAEEDVCLAGVENFKFYIMKAGETSYYVRPMGASDNYLYNLNGKLGFTTDIEQALVITLGEGDPTSNEGTPSVSTISVIAKEGAIQIAGAQGKKVVVSNILGQVIANTVLSSDDATIAAPQGIVVVVVEGEAAVKAIVK